MFVVSKCLWYQKYKKYKFHGFTKYIRIIYFHRAVDRLGFYAAASSVPFNVLKLGFNFM